MRTKVEDITKFRPTIGNVLMELLPPIEVTTSGMETTHNKRQESYRKATVIGIGPKDSYKRDPNLVKGAVFQVPHVGKQMFIDLKSGKEYCVVHHRELKLRIVED